MNSSTRSGHFASVARSAALLLALCTAAGSASAQPVAAPGAVDATQRIEAPDGAPTVATERNIDSRSVTDGGRISTSMTVSEERVQGRLANARVSVGGARAYLVADPAVGRIDRQADNAGRRVAPAVWELLRF
ncbi:MAG: hypothetical protein JNL19_15085 [Burkholderiales bacterium]|nr:hypothetical protein [Burkholderiales bacterium]